MGGSKDNFGNGNNFEKSQKDLEKGENSQSGFFTLLKRNSFWIGFLGTSLLMGMVVITYNLLVEKGKQVEQKKVQNKSFLSKKRALEKLKKEIFNTLKENNEEILAKAWKDSRPQIKELERKNLLETQKFVEAKLNLYFSKVEKTNVERFLDWFYSFGTDYKVVFRQFEDVIKSVKCKMGNWKSCLQNSVAERYIEAQINKYLLNRENLQRYIKVEIAPFLGKKLKEFIQKSLEIVQTNYRKEAKKLLQREFKDSKISERELNKIIAESVGLQEIQISNKVVKELDFRLGRNFVAVVGTVIGTKIVAGITKKIARELTVKIAEKVAAKAAEKTGAKVLTGISGFGSGVFFCSWAGPFSLVCGIAAGVASSLATDYALTKLDEAIGRDEMRAELINLLEEAKTNLVLQLVEIHRKNLVEVESIMEEVLSKQSLKLRDLKR